jgi:hypothetical protein
MPFVIGLALVLLTTLAAAIPYDRPGTAAPATEMITLGGAGSLGQSFVAEGDELVGVRLFIAPDVRGTATTLRLRVRYANGPPVDLAAATASLGAAREDELEVRIPPVLVRPGPGALTATLRLELDLPAQALEGSARVGVSRDGYPGGVAFVDGAADQALDLAFTPLYRRTLLDLVWPVSVMAAGRPGLLGWPPIYPLLAGVFMLTLARAAAHVVAQAKEQG